MARKRILLKITSAVALSVAAVLAAWCAFTFWIFRPQRGNLFFNQQSAASLVQLVEQGRMVGKMLSKSCVTKEDFSSIGHRAEEQRMEGLSQLMTLYEAEFGATPKEVSDLAILSRKSKPAAAYLDELARKCSIAKLEGDTTLLNCDALVLTPVVTNVASTFNPRLRKFYIVGGHEVLFRPAVKCY